MLRQTANEIRGKLVAGSAKCSIVNMEWQHDEVIAIAVDEE